MLCCLLIFCWALGIFPPFGPFSASWLNAAVNIGVQMSVWVPAFNLFKNIPGVELPVKYNSFKCTT